MDQIIISGPQLPQVGLSEMLFVGKALFVLMLLGYVFFTVLVVRQVQMIAAALNGLLDVPVRALAYGQVLLAVLVLLVGVVIL